MRTALMLLFLLAVAAAPGSLFPQRNLGVEKVDAYYVSHPRLAPWLDRIALFDVYASPWFGAIYLLLLISLVGCLLPRLREHASALCRRPPQAPRHLSRLPAHADLGAAGADHADTADRLRALLAARRYRVAVSTGADGQISVAAEKGHLRETGNLLFHFSLLAMLVGVATGYGWGWYGNRLLVAGPETGFCTGIQQFDEYGLGPRIDATDVPGYCFQLERFTAEFLDSGQPTVFRADLSWSTAAGPSQTADLQVNTPLRLGDATLYLLGHGYAPVLRYTDRAGRAQTAVTPFLPVDGMLTSDGVALFPDANADTRTGERSSDAQVGFSGVFMPTAGPAAVSAYPGERDPVVILNAYRGDLGLDSGIAQSVYQLPGRPLADGRLRQLPGQATTLRPGGRWTLDDGSTLEFVGTRRWITVTVRDDPGEPIVLAAAVALLTGLLCSLSVRRRRVWFRVTPGPHGCAVEAAGLPRLDYPGFRGEFDAIVTAGRAATGITEHPAGSEAPPRPVVTASSSAHSSGERDLS